MSFTRYPDLPAELRVEVRKFALKAWCTDTNDHIAALACVNKEWQFDIERFLFRNLILQSYPQHSSDEESDLRCFDDIVRGVRRSFVKSIRLIIDPDGKEYFSDSHWYAVSCHSIHYLLRILEQWGMAGTGKNVIDVSLYWGIIDEGGMWPGAGALADHTDCRQPRGQRPTRGLHRTPRIIVTFWNLPQITEPY